MWLLFVKTSNIQKIFIMVFVFEFIGVPFDKLRTGIGGYNMLVKCFND